MSLTSIRVAYAVCHCFYFEGHLFQLPSYYKQHLSQAQQATSFCEQNHHNIEYDYATRQNNKRKERKFITIYSNYQNVC